MKSMKKVLLGMALAVGVLGFTAAPAHAAHVGVYVGVGAPAAYMPPSPGPGYAWVDGYWAGGYWTPGYWNYVGVAPVYGYGRAYYGDRDDYYRGRDWDRDRDRYRDYDRDRDRDRDREHFRR